jgi:hypothetical protein
VRTDDPPVEDNDDGFAVNVTTGAFGFELLLLFKLLLGVGIGVSAGEYSPFDPKPPLVLFAGPTLMGPDPVPPVINPPLFPVPTPVPVPPVINPPLFPVPAPVPFVAPPLPITFGFFGFDVPSNGAKTLPIPVGELVVPNIWFLFLNRKYTAIPSRMTAIIVIINALLFLGLFSIIF